MEQQKRKRYKRRERLLSKPREGSLIIPPTRRRIVVSTREFLTIEKTRRKAPRTVLGRSGDTNNHYHDQDEDENDGTVHRLFTATRSVAKERFASLTANTMRSIKADTLEIETKESSQQLIKNARHSRGRYLASSDSVMMKSSKHQTKNAPRPRKLNQTSPHLRDSSSRLITPETKKRKQREESMTETRHRSSSIQENERAVRHKVQQHRSPIVHNAMTTGGDGDIKPTWRMPVRQSSVKKRLSLAEIDDVSTTHLSRWNRRKHLVSPLLGNSESNLELRPKASKHSVSRRQNPLVHCETNSNNSIVRLAAKVAVENRSISRRKSQNDGSLLSLASASTAAATTIITKPRLQEEPVHGFFLNSGIWNILERFSIFQVASRHTYRIVQQVKERLRSVRLSSEAYRHRSPLSETTKLQELLAERDYWKNRLEVIQAKCHPKLLAHISRQKQQQVVDQQTTSEKD